MSENTGYEHFFEVVRIVAVSGPASEGPADKVIVIRQTSGAPITITLIQTPWTGRKVTIKDGKGDASVNNITILPYEGTIDGQTSLVLTNNYASVDLLYNGIEWNIL